MSGLGISIFLLVIFFIIIIALSVWIYYMYKNPTCTATPALCDAYCKSSCSSNCPSATPTYIPYIIYGVDPANCVSAKSAKGVLTQNGNTLNFTPASDGSNTTSQWYLIPTSNVNQFNLQNVSSRNYITVNPGSSTITMQPVLANATSFFWQLSKTDNTNYFVYNSPANNGCPNNSQYIIYNNTNIEMGCVQSGVKGQWWFSVPATVAFV